MSKDYSNFSNIPILIVKLMKKRATVNFEEMEQLANNVANHLNDKEKLQDDLKRANELYAKYDPYDEEEGYMFEALEIIVAMIKDIIR